MACRVTHRYLALEICVDRPTIIRTTAVLMIIIIVAFIIIIINIVGFSAFVSKIPSKRKDFDVKYSPMGRVIIRIVKNNSVLSTETREPSFLNE